MKTIFYRDDGGLYGGKRSKKINGIDGLSFTEIVKQIEGGKSFITYPFFIQLGFFWLKDISSVYLVDEKKENKLLWLICLCVTAIPMLVLMLISVLLLCSTEIPRDLLSIVIRGVILLMAVSPLGTVITLLKDGGVDLTNEVLNILENCEDIEK